MIVDTDSPVDWDDDVPLEVSEDKLYFLKMVATVREKLSRHPGSSLIRAHFQDVRLDEIEKKIAGTDASDLEWTYWQPFFLFLKNASEAEIDILDDDLRIVSDRTPLGESPVCRFLRDETEDANPWVGGLFEVFAKAALLRSNFLTVDALDWRLPNGRDIDAKVRIGQRTVGVEITTRGDSTAAKGRWERHCTEILAEDRDQAFCESQDAYAPGRWLYDTVFNKLALDFNATRSQFLPDAANLLLIGLSPLVSDLTPSSPAIGWALDELFSRQPTQNNSPVSLEAYLRHKLQGQTGTMTELLAAPSEISGVLVFDRCTLKVARINYNAREGCRLSHEEMACFEKVLACPPAYCN